MNNTNPVVTLTMDNGSIIKAELYPQIAPNTVNNFISLTKAQFFDGLTFHRIIPGFMIQGGCPTGTGTGGPGYGIKGEFNENGFENDLKHTPGVLSMARAQHPDSAGCQFFIMDQPAPHLDGSYAGFGQVIEGMDTVRQIVATPLTNPRMGTPKVAPVIKSITVDTKGVEYSEPETNNMR